MRAAMPPVKLAALWKDLADAGGRYQGRSDDTQLEPVPDFTCIYVTCRWERQQADLKIVFDKSGRISGLWTVEP